MVNNVGQWWLFRVGGSEEGYGKLYRIGGKIEGYLFRVDGEIGSISGFTASGWGNWECFRIHGQCGQMWDRWVRGGNVGQAQRNEPHGVWSGWRGG